MAAAAACGGGLAREAHAGAAPALEQQYINRTTDAAGAAMPKWAWAPGLTQLPDGTLLSTFVASAKVGGASDIEISDATSVYFSRKAPGAAAWSAPAKAAFDTVQVAEMNPQLHQVGGETWLIYGGVPRPANGAWPGNHNSSSLYLRRSTDGGQTWGAASMLRGSDGGAAFSSLSGTKPITLADGTHVIPFYNQANTTNYGGVLRSTNGGQTWSEFRVPQNAAAPFATMPSVQQMPDGTLRSYLRTYGVNADASKQLLHTSTSADGGVTWSQPTQTPAIRNPSSRVDFVRRGNELILAGNDAVRLPNLDGATGRKEVNVLLSQDLGTSWAVRKTLAKNYDMTAAAPEGQIEWGYPTIVNGNDGFVHVVYGSRTDKKNTTSQIVYQKVDRAWFDLPNPTMWFDASDPDADLDPYDNPANNAGVSTWKDKTGNGYDLTNAGGGQPLYVTDGGNGRPSVFFNGTGTTSGAFMRTPAVSASTITGDARDGMTIFAVMKQEDINRAGVILGWQSEAGDPKNRVVLQNQNRTGTEALRFDFKDDSTANSLVGNTNLSDGGFHVLSAVRGAGGTSIFIDGVLEGTLATSAALSDASAFLQLGAVFSNVSNANAAYGRFYMSELLTYAHGLSEAERNYVGVYLGDKYGIDTAYAIAPVPEPAAAMTLAGGAAAVALLRRRRRAAV